MSLGTSRTPEVAKSLAHCVLIEQGDGSAHLDGCSPLDPAVPVEPQPPPGRAAALAARPWKAGLTTSDMGKGSETRTHRAFGGPLLNAKEQPEDKAEQ